MCKAICNETWVSRQRRHLVFIITQNFHYFIKIYYFVKIDLINFWTKQNEGNL